MWTHLGALSAVRDPIRLESNDNTYYFKNADTSGPSLAGLLDFPNTKELGKWLESQTVRDLWNRYNNFRMQEFGGIAIRATPIGFWDSMDLRAKDDIRELSDWTMSSGRTFQHGHARSFRAQNPPLQYLDPANPSYRRPDDSRFLVKETHLSATAGGPTPLRQRQASDPLTDELLWEIEQQMDSTDDSLLGRIGPQTIGVNSASRIPFMKEIAKRVTVLQTGGNRLPTANQGLVELAGNAAGVAGQNPDQLADNAATLTLEETESFWQLQNAIGSLWSASVPTYDEAKTLFPWTNKR
ncbi:MAG: hypothetical protein M1839_007249 [Geoglossum umbratile]|nr:MAG: hypothetical protein M1839_007249 [Geoglossum umbratile]